MAVKLRKKTGATTFDSPITLITDDDVTAYTPTLSWGTQSTIATINGKSAKVTMPANPAKTYYAGNGIALDNTTFSIATHTANYVVGGYLNTHPENNGVLIPFMHNDIAYLTLRGGSYTVTYDGVEQDVDLSKCFDASPNYGLNILPVNLGVTEIVIVLTLQQKYTWSNRVYIDFGASSWRCKNVKIEVMCTDYANDTWTSYQNVTNQGSGFVVASVSHTPTGASNAGAGFNKVRFTLSGWNGTSTSTIFRISELGLYNYSSLGLRQTFMPRDGGEMYGILYPRVSNQVDFGKSTNAWKNGYITNLNSKTVSAENSNGAAGEFFASRTSGNTTRNIWFGFGSGDVNRGIYDMPANRWVVYTDGGNNSYLNGTATQVSTSLTFNDSGLGADSGTTFNGATAKTISYNTIGAAAAGHTHTLSLATDSGTASITLAHNTTYKLTAGGSSLIFKIPTDNNGNLTQNVSTTSDYRPLILGQSNANPANFSDVNASAYYNKGLYVQPSTSSLYANVLYENGTALANKYVAQPTTVTYSSFATNGWQKFLAQTDYSKPFFAHLRIYTKGVSETAINQVMEFYVVSRSNNVKIFGFESTRTTWGGNSGIYQLRAYAPKDITSGYANYAGGLELHINSTTARDIQISIIELDNCTVLSAPVASVYNATYHNNTGITTCSNRWFGADIQGSSDASASAYCLRFADTKTKTSASVGIGRRTLYIYDEQRGDGASITTTFNSTGTSHTVNTTTVFHIGSHIMYNSVDGDYAASSSSTVYTSTYSQHSSKQDIDLRYSCNCGTTGFTVNSPLYLRVTPDFSTGTFTIHSDGLTQTLTSGGHYIYLGIINASTSYKLQLFENQKMYYYNGTNLIEPLYGLVISALNTAV